jgi:hypothetical protein
MNANRNRRLMSIDLARLSSFDVGAVFIQKLVHGDAEALARLMLDAYRGTIDDEGGHSFEDAKAEVRRTFDGEYGEMIWDASFVAM